MVGDGIIDLCIIPKDAMLFRILLPLECPVQLMQPHLPRLFCNIRQEKEAGGHCNTQQRGKRPAEIGVQHGDPVLTVNGAD
ncbi:hypothetical protein D3C73_1555030 [compost metagenome]